MNSECRFENQILYKDMMLYIMLYDNTDNVF